MEFIDHTGHVFSLPSYDSMPIGYEYRENPYVFWLNDETTYTLSIDNYYFKPIRALVAKEDYDAIVADGGMAVSITLTSDVFSLIGSKQVQELMAKSKSILHYIELSERDFKKKLTNDDIIIVEGLTTVVGKKYRVEKWRYTWAGREYDYLGEVQDGNVGIVNIGGIRHEVELTLSGYEERYLIGETRDSFDIDGHEYQLEDYVRDYVMIPFYVVGYAQEPGTWETNVLISLSSTRQKLRDGVKVLVNSANEDRIVSILHDTISEITIYEDVNGSMVKMDTIVQDFSNGGWSWIITDEATTQEDGATWLVRTLDYKMQSGHRYHVDGVSPNARLIYNYRKGMQRPDTVLLADGSFNAPEDITNIGIMFQSTEIADLNNYTEKAMYGRGTSAIVCPVTVGGEFVDESEELIINGQNMGIMLPKSILKAVYGTSFFNDHVDEHAYAVKLKEYLMNYMGIRGECGNFASAIKALKWFGWGGKLDMHKLMQTDNTIQQQYIRDYFDIVNDTSLHSFQAFRHATLISLSLPITDEGPEQEQDFGEEFWGEGKPTIVSHMQDMEYVTYDEGDIKFYRGYFDYTFDELGLKLCALKHYYQKYFLPIHLTIGSISLEQQCFMNDIKLLITPYNKLSERPVLTQDYNVIVEFPAEGVRYFMHQVHYIDENYNEFLGTKHIGETTSEQVYYINDTCVNIPISFHYASNPSQEDETFYCTMLLMKDGVCIHEASFAFTQRYGDRWTEYKNFIIHPKTMNKVKTGDDKKFDITYWLKSSYVLKLQCNGRWFEYKFTMALPELSIQLGRLKYKYEYPHYEGYRGVKRSLFPQLYGFRLEKDGEQYVTTDGQPPLEDLSNVKRTIMFNAFMYQPQLVTVNNDNFIEEVTAYMRDNGLAYVDEQLVEDNALYYYVEHDGVKYVFGSDKVSHFMIEDGAVLYDESITHVIPEFIDGKHVGTWTLVDPSSGTTVTGLELKSSVNKNMSTYIKSMYTVKNNTVDGKYLNRCHLLDVYEYDQETQEISPIPYRPEMLGEAVETIDVAGRTITFGDNSSEETVAMYKQFFDDDGMCYMKDLVSEDGHNTSALEVDKMKYDFYLMHDETQWYGVMISQATLKDVPNQRQTFEFFNGTSSIIVHKTRDDRDSFIEVRYGTIDAVNGTYYVLHDGGWQKVDAKLYIESVIDSNTEDSKMLFRKNAKYTEVDYQYMSTNTGETYYIYMPLEHVYKYASYETARKLLVNGTAKVYHKSWSYDWIDDNSFVRKNMDMQYYTSDGKLITGETYIMANPSEQYYRKKMYMLQYRRSDDKVLINRLDYEACDGVNHFEQDDMVALTLVNNARLPFKLALGSKWVVKPMSLGMGGAVEVESPNEMAVMSIGTSNTKYARGYYNVTCRYSFDDFMQHQQEKIAKLRIG